MSEELIDLYDVHKGIFNKILEAIEKRQRRVIYWIWRDIAVGIGIDKRDEKIKVKLVMYHVRTRTWFTFYEKEVKDVLVKAEETDISFGYANEKGSVTYFLYTDNFVIEASESLYTGRLNIEVEKL